MMSLELKILIECIKVGILNQSVVELIDLLKSNNIDWNQFSRKLKFHSIRPIVYQAFAKIDVTAFGVPENIFEDLRNYATQQTINNLLFTNETINILKAFKENDLEIILYKGNLFIHEIFNNQQLRETGDIDILIKPKDFVKGISVLKSLGYKVADYFMIEGKEEQIDSIKFLLDRQVLPELSLVKNIFQLDYHSELAPFFYPYKIDLDKFFFKLEHKEFASYQTALPNSNLIFWMIQLHNGGKDAWVKLKHLVDLMMFMNKFGDSINWNQIIIESKEYKLKNIMLNGFKLLKDEFGYQLPVIIQNAIYDSNPSSDKLIIDYWDYSFHWLTLKARLKFERVFVNIQDSDFSLKQYFYNFVKFYSIPRPIEEAKRIIVFPERFTFSNFAAKVISYLYHRKF